MINSHFHELEWESVQCPIRRTIFDMQGEFNDYEDNEHKLSNAKYMFKSKMERTLQLFQAVCLEGINHVVFLKCLEKGYVSRERYSLYYIVIQVVIPFSISAHRDEIRKHLLRQPNLERLTSFEYIHLKNPEAISHNINNMEELLQQGDWQEIELPNHLKVLL